MTPRVVNSLMCAILLLVPALLVSSSGGFLESEMVPLAVSRADSSGVSTLNVTGGVTIYGQDLDNGEMEEFGHVVGAGDINDDGYDDFFIGNRMLWYGGVKQAGALYGWYGNATANTQTDYDTASGDYDFCIFSTSMESQFPDAIEVGDLDADGVNELIIGGHRNAGAAYIFWGQTTKFSGNINRNTADVIITGVGGKDNAFHSLACGDIDNDGNDDIIAGAWNADGENDDRFHAGEAYVFFGDTEANMDLIGTATKANITIYGANGSATGVEGDLLGSAVALGDINDDGYADMIVGAPGGDAVDDSGNHCGEAHVVFGGARTGLPSVVYVNQSAAGTHPDISIWAYNDGDAAGISLESDDLDGDGIDDLVLGSNGAGYKDIYFGGGNTYIFWGNTTANLNDTYNLRFGEFDSVLYGDSNYNAYALGTGDVNGDGRRDLLIGAPGAPGAYNGYQGGEVNALYGRDRSEYQKYYHLNGSWDSWPHQDLRVIGHPEVMTGAAGDKTGFSVASGDFDNDGIDDIVMGAEGADGPSDARPDDGEAYVFFGIGLSNRGLAFTGSKNHTIFPRHRTYEFRVNASHTGGGSNIDEVTFTLDPGNVSLQFRWRKAGDVFEELSDPNEHVHLLSTSADSNVADKNLTLNFRINFNWSYPSSELSDCLVETTDSSSNMVETVYYNVFKVEKRLQFYGFFAGDAEVQGALFPSDFVAGGEEIDWTGLRVMYYDSNFVADPQFYNITITDSDNNTWTNSTLTTGPFNITTRTKNSSDSDYIHTVNITGAVAGSIPLDGRQFKVRVDADAPEAPPNIVCHADNQYDPNQYDNDLEIYVTWDAPADPGGSGIYRYMMAYDDPFPSTFSNSGDSATGEEGKDKRFYVRALDNVGNVGPSDHGNISIDLTSLTTSGLFPSTTDWFNVTLITCGASFSDIGGSGVNGLTMQYRFTNDGTLPATWTNLPIPSGETVNPSVLINYLSDGTENRFQFRAKDNADTGYVETPVGTLKIDTTPLTYGSVYPQTSDWFFSRQVEVGVFFNDTGSGVDASSIQYAFSTDGFDHFSDWIDGGYSTDAGSIDFKTTIDFADGINNYFKFRAQDVAGNGWVQTPAYQLRFDLTNISFTGTTPDNGTWFTNTSITCTAEIEDPTGAGVDGTSIQYSFSTNDGISFSDWFSVTGYSAGKKKITAQVVHVFTEGMGNIVRWRAKGMNSDDWFYSWNTYFYVDVSAPTFFGAVPADDRWGLDTQITSSINVTDNFAGVDAATIEYAFSISGPTGYYNWKAPDNVADNGDGTFTASTALKLSYGTENYVKWRAMDVLGNGYRESGGIQMKVNSIPVAKITDPRAGFPYYESLNMTFDGNASFEDDGDPLTFLWTSNVTGELGNSSYLVIPMTPGHHLITLTVTDPMGYSSDATVEIFVNATLPKNGTHNGTGGGDDDTDDDIKPPDDDVDDDVDPQPDVETSNRDYWIMILLLITAAILIAGLGLYIYRSRKAESDKWKDKNAELEEKERRREERDEEEFETRRSRFGGIGPVGPVRGSKRASKESVDWDGDDGSGGDDEDDDNESRRKKKKEMVGPLHLDRKSKKKAAGDEDEYEEALGLLDDD